MLWLRNRRIISLLIAKFVLSSMTELFSCFSTGVSAILSPKFS